MTDDPYPSPKPVVNAIAGFLIAVAMIAAPFAAISRVKFENKVDCTTSRINCRTP